MRALRSGIALLLVVGLAGCSSEEDLTMPDVVGKKLDVALSDIEGAGFEDDVDVNSTGLFGVVDESNWVVCEQTPAAGEAVEKPKLSVDRSCDDEGAEEPAQDPSETETEAETDGESESAAPEYAYAGPAYEVVVVDKNVGPAKLKQYWVYAAGLDPSKASYQNQVKLIISDLAHKAGSAKFLADVVTDREIALAEAFPTQQDFIDEHGFDYFVKDIPKRERKGWIASYAGGFDYETGEASDDAFEVTWMIASDNPEFEDWKPEAGE